MDNLLHFLLQADTPPDSDTDEIRDWLSNEGLTVLAIVLFVVAAIVLVNIFVPRIVRFATRARLDGKDEEEVKQRADTLTRVFIRSGGTLLVILGFITALPEFGIQIGPLLAGVGIAGIAIGFGAQSLVKDFFAGTFILLDNQYSRGDVVEVAGKIGTVEDIGIRRTVLRDMGGAVHWVPNGQIAVATNFTQEFASVNMIVSVSYAEDLDHVMAVINEVGRGLAEDQNWKDVVLEAPYALRVDALGESAIDIKIIGNVRPIRQWEVMGELRRRLKRRFDEEGIEIPFPHRVLVHEAKAGGPSPEDGGQGYESTPKTTRPAEDPKRTIPDSSPGSSSE